MSTIRCAVLVILSLNLCAGMIAAQDLPTVIDPDIVAELGSGRLFAQGLTPCEVLVTVTDGNGEPGQSGRPVQVLLQTNQAITHLEFEVHDTPDLLTAGGCNSAFGGFTCNVADSGVASVIFSSASSSVGPSTDFVALELLYTVDPGAPTGTINLIPMLLSAIDDNQDACSVAGMPGSFTVSTCGNGLTQGNEECDDGNTEDGDCCSATCTLEPAGATCDDGLFCTANDSCNAGGTCTAGAARDCDDGIACTDNTCDETADSCTVVPIDAVCDNGLICDGDEICSPTVGCAAGTPLDCDDGIACTEDLCREAEGGCVPFPVDAFCDNGLFCDGTETCDIVSGCLAGTSLVCDDGELCTDDSCNEAIENCLFEVDLSNDPTCGCGNGVLDAGEECDDGNLLDGDCCSSTCTTIAAGTPCDDDAFCTVDDSCDGAGVCSGASRDCDDAVGCTMDSCDESIDQCVHPSDHASCSDGLFCNGIELCDQLLDCQPNFNSCPVGSCNEVLDTCSVSQGAPATSVWGLFAMTLALLGAGYWIFGRRS